MLNLLFISADDMSYGSLGYSGCEFQEITPTLDKLASEGVFFNNAHTTVGLCQPSRSVWMTGMYPWKSGAEGFQPINYEVTTLTEILHKAGYSCGIMGKTEHLTPPEKFIWEYKVKGYSNAFGLGKQPDLFYHYSLPFFKTTKQPFFLMANSHHPHREFPAESRYDPTKVVVPPFLPDADGVRKELSQYYEGVTQCDRSVAYLLDALKESGKADNTLIIFTSDHGMAFPFVKAHCYHYSTKVPLIWHIPSILSPRVSEEYVSGIDILPTILEMLSVNYNTQDCDGRSYANTLKYGKSFSDQVYTCLVKSFNHRYYQIRAIHDKSFCYIRNYWANGTISFTEDGGLDHQLAMIDLKRHRPEAHRMLRFRTPEELYDLTADPYAQNNLVGKGTHKSEIYTAKMRLARAALQYNDTLPLSYTHPKYKPHL